MTLDAYDKLECLRLAKDIAISSGLIKNSSPEEYILAVAKKFEEFITPIEPAVESPTAKPIEWIEYAIV